MSVTRTVSRSMNSDCERDLPSHVVIGGGVMVEDAKHRVGMTRRTNVCLCNDGANAAAAAAALLIKLLLSATVRAIPDIVPWFPPPGAGGDMLQSVPRGASRLLSGTDYYVEVSTIDYFNKGLVEKASQHKAEKPTLVRRLLCCLCAKCI